MSAFHRELDMAGVALRRRVALLALRAARVARALRAVRALAGALPRALLVRRRRLPAARARAAAPRRRAAALPGLLARARAALAALAALASVGGRLDPLVAAARLRPELGALPELGGRLLPDAPVAVPAARAAPRARHPRRRAPASRAPPLAPRPSACRARPSTAARGLAGESQLLERVR